MCEYCSIVEYESIGELKFRDSVEYIYGNVNIYWIDEYVNVGKIKFKDYNNFKYIC